MKAALFFLYFIQISYSYSVEKLFNVPKNALSLLLMGDTQYYFKCEPGNVPCKKVSKKCRDNYGLDYYLYPTRQSNGSVHFGQQQCAKVENRYANRVQRQAIDTLIAKMKYKPAALIINGDLTDFGHLEELQEFKRGWLRSFPIPILAGLGNHDYENNVNDCAFNFCAHSMLSWFMSYAKNMSLDLEYERTAKSAFDISYKGSFAYSTRVCSITGTNCAYVIQLNNAIDFERNFSSVMVNWQITSAMEVLKKELKMMKDMDMPILINMHQCDGVRVEKLKELLGDFIYETRKYGHQKRIAVTFAHWHSNHSVRTYCFHNTPVVFAFVGSVPNNRFTFLEIGKSSSNLYGVASRDSFEFKDNLKLLGVVEDVWKPCSKAYQTYYAFKNEPFQDLSDMFVE